MNLSFQKMFFAITTIIALFAILVLAKPIMVPLAFALLISFILFPLATKLEYWGIKRTLAAFLSIFSVIILILAGIYLFSSQIFILVSEFAQFQDKILQLFAEATVFFNDNINFAQDLEKGELMDRLETWLSTSAGKLVGQAFSSSAHLITGIVATIIFAFLFLIYRDSLVVAFTHFFPAENKVKALNLFKSVQQVGMKYLVGVILIMITLGIINSIGLMIIGIDNPFLFGFLAAVLAIVPYVGTTLGAAIPVLYAFMTYDSIWKGIAVLIWFWAVQVIESNYLSPKIVGGSLQVNALAAILSIIIGAAVWGVAGMILFLPFTAMLRVVCDEFIELKPIALLIGDHNNSRTAEKTQRMGKWMKRLKNWFTN